MQTTNGRQGWLAPVLLVMLAALCGLAMLAVQPGSDKPSSESAIAAATSNSTRHPVTIRPRTAPRIAVGSAEDGRPVTVACGTCHANRPASADQGLVEFHQGLSVSHAKLSCLSCHNADDYDTLRLADGTTLHYADSMQLCAQCHGSIANDYQHGAHGGMEGHWDLTRGPRVRNHCIDCHDPHRPAFPKMQPTFKPRDRFLNPKHPHAGEEADE